MGGLILTQAPGGDNAAKVVARIGDYSKVLPMLTRSSMR
jgi:hypothetical protein